MKKHSITQQLIAEFNNATQELFTQGSCGDDIGLFDAKEMTLNEIKERLEDDAYLIALALVEHQVTGMAKYLEFMVDTDMTGTMSADSVERMLFSTKNYRAVCAMVFGIQKLEEDCDPRETTAFSSVALTCDDLNRLVSRDENNILSVLNKDEFEAFGGDYQAMLAWVQAQRFSQVPSHA